MLELDLRHVWHHRAAQEWSLGVADGDDAAPSKYMTHHHNIGDLAVSKHTAQRESL
jgi:hypothetical protein